MKRLLTVGLAALFLMSALTGCHSKEDAQRIADLEAENAQLSARIQDLNEQLTILTEQVEAIDTLKLAGWQLAPIISDEENAPVTVQLTAEPAAYRPEQKAVFLVILDGQEAASVPCEWDGTTYTATAVLKSADGYGYYCILTGSNGMEETITLCTPDSASNLSNLASSLETYCNLVIADWETDDEVLTILSGTGMIQLPVLSNDETSVTCESAKLHLYLGEEEVDSADMTAQKGETANSFLVPIEDVTFEIPEMEDDDQLDLVLTVVMSNGNEMKGTGGSWYLSNGSLDLVAG